MSRPQGKGRQASLFRTRPRIRLEAAARQAVTAALAALIAEVLQPPARPRAEEGAHDGRR